MKLSKVGFIQIAEKAIKEGEGLSPHDIALQIYARVSDDKSDEIASLRKGKGFTQEHLALLLGVAQVQVSRWERGLHRPSEETMSKIREVTR